LTVRGHVTYGEHMTEQAQGDEPAWTLGDRLRKAREHAGLSQAELAWQIGIARSSIVNYESDRSAPGRPVLLSWALCTGVRVPWLLAGSESVLRGHSLKADCLCAA
jgi:transcriptional regulator with XRE-family HTH domain